MLILLQSTYALLKFLKMLTTLLVSFLRKTLLSLRLLSLTTLLFAMGVKKMTGSRLTSHRRSSRELPISLISMCSSRPISDEVLPMNTLRSTSSPLMTSRESENCNHTTSRRSRESRGARSTSKKTKESTIDQKGKMRECLKCLNYQSLLRNPLCLKVLFQLKSQRNLSQNLKLNLR